MKATGLDLKNLTLSDCMICSEMYGNGATIYTTKQFMAHIGFLEVEVGATKNEVLWQQPEDEATQYYLKLTTLDLGLQEILLTNKQQSTNKYGI